MAVLVVGRARFVDTVSSAIQSHGFDSLGVTSDAEALSNLLAGSVTTLVIGGGVEQASRDALKKEAAARGVTVVEGALGYRDIGSYVRQVILPRLLGTAGLDRP